MSITGIKDHKALRKLIEELRLDKNKAIIGSKAGSNGGYYICETEEEKQKTINHFKHRAGQMYKIAHILEREEGVKMNTVQPIRDLDTIHAIQEDLKENNFRNYLMFEIGIYIGIRISDILNIKVKDIKDKNNLKMREIKTNKEKLMPIPTHLQKEINSYISDADLKDNEYLFKSKKNKIKPISRVQAYYILNKIAKKYKLENIGTHTLRKTFGYHFYKKTQDVALLMTIFNHSDPSITLRYIGIEQDNVNKSLKNFKY